MAIVKGPFQISGSVSGVSFYTRRGSDQVIMRSKGGVKGDKMKRMSQFDGFRTQQKEWSGCTKWASGVRLAFGGLHRLADYNISSVLNGLGNKLQKMDTTTPKGKRPVQLSSFKQALDGFHLNRTYPFNGALRVSTSVEIDREQLSASVIIPRINTDIDLQNIQRLPYFRIIVVLGTASDMFFDEQLNDYLPMVAGLHGASVITNSEWYSANSIIDEQTITARMTHQQVAMLSDSVSMILSIGVEFGMVGFNGKPVEVKYAGSAKVLRVV